ncbi:MAG: RdgB/HAM1 family non-canonical purine NTP pyrophosphatase [Cytophagales bacterium]|nr:MAG: RdgB/HAM1 family non-canonical purine NTP pyrophosphatase [Cytophagales bacterium]TAF60279.1 MAG: RdgB/HAM1 family non-canonical purine NTP pyrophosphatase [Cytophagales bacterium]
MKLCICSHNTHKVREINEFLGSHFELQSLTDIGCLEDIPETATTFLGNAQLKAQHVWKHYQLNGFSDDSGLCVGVLGGAPGVYSARYAGVGSKDSDNLKLILEHIKPYQKPEAYFICVIVLILNGQEYHFEGRVSGHLIHTPRGTQGFGYDPIFVPEGHQQTFAEMLPKQKNELSHRSKALAQLKNFLDAL